MRTILSYRRCPQYIFQRPEGSFLLNQINHRIYFNVRKFKDYGKLSNQNLNEIIENARGVINEDKKHPVIYTELSPIFPNAKLQ